MPLQYQQVISDLMVLAGVASAILSIILVIVALAQTRAPRGGALALVLGIILLAAGAFTSTQPVRPGFVVEAWSRVITPKAQPGPAPVTVPETTATPPTTPATNSAPTAD